VGIVVAQRQVKPAEAARRHHPPLRRGPRGEVSGANATGGTREGAPSTQLRRKVLWCSCAGEQQDVRLDPALCQAMAEACASSAIVRGAALRWVNNFRASIACLLTACSLLAPCRFARLGFVSPACTCSITVDRLLSRAWWELACHGRSLAHRRCRGGELGASYTRCLSAYT
jgi:hypothetical protein